MTLEKACKKLLVEQPFYGLFMLGMNKGYSEETDTACVYKDGIGIRLAVNPKFWDTLNDEMQISILEHELGHVLNKNLTTFWKEYNQENHTRLNVAFDLEVNSAIPLLQKDPYCYPQMFGFGLFKGSKWYWNNLPNNIKNPPQNHDWKSFEGLSDAEKQLVEKQIDFQAKNAAEETVKKNGWGSIPNQFREYVKNLFKERDAVFDWKAYFRRLLGSSIQSYIKSTRYKPSKRFPDARGTILKFKPKVLVGVDTSGSVSNDELADFFTEIEHLYKSGVQVTICEFDTRIHTKFEYKGKKTEIEIGGRGGTDATELFDFYLANPSYSTLVVFTDGYLNVSKLPKTANSIWVITSNGRRQEYPGKVCYIPNDKK